jgi:hypothetical protein
MHPSPASTKCTPSPSSAPKANMFNIKHNAINQPSLATHSQAPAISSAQKLQILILAGEVAFPQFQPARFQVSDSFKPCKAQETTVLAIKVLNASQMIPSIQRVVIIAEIVLRIWWACIFSKKWCANQHGQNSAIFGKL